MCRIIIITSYIEGSNFIAQTEFSGSYVICTDGGYDTAKRFNITPDLVIGDFDSISSALPQDIKTERFPPEKDYTDLEIAVRKAASLNAGSVEIFGGIGGRLDHTVANLQIISQYRSCFDSLIMRDGRNKCFAVEDTMPMPVEINYEPDSYISIFSLSDISEGVTFSNVKYPLGDYTLTRKFPLGTSNEFANNKSAFLTVKKGTLLVVISKK